MTKFLTATLVALVSSAALAGTFVVPPTATLTGNPDGTVSWSGVALGSIVHFRDVNAPPVEHKVSGMSGSIQLKDVASNGGRFQVRDVNGNWAWLTPNGTRFVLAGAHLDCTNPDGCALEVNGTGPKSAPVPSYPGGVYQGYQPAQQLASTSQVVGVNTTQMAVAPVGGAVVTPVAIVPSPTVVSTSQSVSTGRYKLVPVMTEAEKAGMKKPAAKVKVKAPTAVAKASPAKDECVPGKPIETKDGTIQCIPKLLTRIADAPQPVGASAAKEPAASAATAPATPPAATAPTAPAAAAKK